MQALRKIVEPQDDEVRVKLPGGFLHKRLEILIFPLEEDRPPAGRFTKFLESSYDLPEFRRPTREERNAR